MTSFRHGRLHTITTEEIEERLLESSLSVVMFFEKGDCECQLQSQVLRELAKEYKRKAFFARLDADTEPLAKVLRVKSVPSLYMMSYGEVLGYARGRFTRAELREAVQEMMSEYQRDSVS